VNGDISPLMVTAFGLTTVFLALLGLVGLLTLMGRLLGGTGKKAQPAAAAPAAAKSGTTKEEPGADIERLRHIAIAAFALHKSRRVAVRGPSPSSEWGTAARVRSTNRTTTFN
jgi:Na+-transporting methylmalonyl-CoA/oxaloacetate decarboxylase gamma subunit